MLGIKGCASIKGYTIFCSQEKKHKHENSGMWFKIKHTVEVS